MIYILGVDHKFQHDRALPRGRDFILYIKGVITARHINLIAEEFSTEALALARKNSSVAQDVAQEMQIDHKYCDPDTSTRAAIGYPSRNEIKKRLNICGLAVEGSPEDKKIKEKEREYFPTREKYWLKQICDQLNRNILFICGADHIVSFTSLLDKRNIRSEILQASEWV